MYFIESVRLHMIYSFLVSSTVKSPSIFWFPLVLGLCFSTLPSFGKLEIICLLTSLANSFF